MGVCSMLRRGPVTPQESAETVRVSESRRPPPQAADFLQRHGKTRTGIQRKHEVADVDLNHDGQISFIEFPPARISDESRRRGDVDSPRRRVAAAPRLPHGYSAEMAAGTWRFRGDESPRLGRGYFVEASRGAAAAATRIFRGGASRRGRGRDGGRSAETSGPRRHEKETSRGAPTAARMCHRDRLTGTSSSTTRS